MTAQLEHFNIEMPGARQLIRHFMGCRQVIVRFPNDYGASVIPDHEVEMAVIRFDGPDMDQFQIAYDTPVTKDVIGYLTPARLITLLKRISELPHA